MRATRLMISITLVACGGNGSETTDAPPTIDAGPPDATVIPGPDAATATCTPVAGQNVVGRIITNLGDMPLLVTAPAGDTRLFVIERTGAIQIIQDDAVIGTFIDLDDGAGGPVFGGGEQGLLGLAFHPDYATNGLFYVSYTTDGANPRTNSIAEYRRSATDTNVADPTPVRMILAIPDFASNHNGGMIEFGSDGYLYLATGDGGGGGDPQGTGQDLSRLLGKMLRIDVDNPSGGREYGIPSTNPFITTPGATPEVFMYGLRNPWRWSFDRGTGDIYIGDVGQQNVEEVSYVAAAQAAGTDFGWNECEGLLNYIPGSGCANPTLPRVAPVYQEVRPAGGGMSDWNSVIGGQVYRGSCYPDLVGRYFYSDYAGRGLYSFVISGGVATDIQSYPGFTASSPSSIHADALGELYITYSNGNIVKIEVQ